MMIKASATGVMLRALQPLRFLQAVLDCSTRTSVCCFQAQTTDITNNNTLAIISRLFCLETVRGKLECALLLSSHSNRFAATRSNKAIVNATRDLKHQPWASRQVRAEKSGARAVAQQQDDRTPRHLNQICCCCCLPCCCRHFHKGQGEDGESYCWCQDLSCCQHAAN